jgi:hypothetical protein
MTKSLFMGERRLVALLKELLSLIGVCVFYKHFHRYAVFADRRSGPQPHRFRLMLSATAIARFAGSIEILVHNLGLTPQALC